MTLILFFLCLSSGSVYAAARWGRKYEELLPVTGCAIVAVLFFFGVLGLLETGFWAVCALCLGLITAWLRGFQVMQCIAPVMLLMATATMTVSFVSSLITR